MLQNTDPEVYQAILAEEKRQAEWMELIASENYQSKAVLQAQASVFANKYAEWFPGKRYYWWQENTDKIDGRMYSTTQGSWFPSPMDLGLLLHSRSKKDCNGS